VELCDAMLRDSCYLQMRDLEYVNKKRAKAGKRLFEPLYEEKDVDELMKHFEAVHMHQPLEIRPGVRLEFFNAGHILGSALVQLDVRGDRGGSHRLLFSGDLGQPDQPILRHFEYPSGADILLVESTYADRLHPSADDVEGRLEEYLKYIDRHNSRLLIPAFSVGRTQQIIWYLNRNLKEEITLDMISERFFISKHHLNKVFRKATGTTVVDYLIRKRISMAQHLLINGYSAQEAATEVGFDDYSAFYRSYVRVTGHSPAQDKGAAVAAEHTQNTTMTL